MAIFSVGMIYAIYTLLTPEKKLPVYNPADVNPKLVDESVAHVRRSHKVADFKRKFDGQLEWFKIGEMVTAKYVKLELLAPTYFSGGWMQIVEFNVQSDSKTGAEPAIAMNRASSIPTVYGLAQNYPNPFNPETTIEFALPEEARVELRIFDMKGHQVATLLQQTLPSGYHRVNWNAAGLPTGIYFYQILANDYRETRKMILVK